MLALGMTVKYTINKIDEMDEQEFVRIFGGVYEYSAWVAERAYRERPFADFGDLVGVFVAVVNQSSDDTKLALLQAHPLLAGKAAQQGQLTAESKEEQSSAGLNQLSEDEMGRVKAFNQLYLDAFGFPFIVAVKNHSKVEIFRQMELRVKNCVEDELNTAIEQVHEIARIRLSALVLQP